MECKGRASRKWLIMLLGVIALGMYLRLECIIRSSYEIRLSPDAREYIMYAWNLSHHGVYSKDPRGLNATEPDLPPDAVRPPGYPLFLMAFLGSDGSTLQSIMAIQLTQAILGGVTILLAYILCKGFLGKWLALIAAALTAFSPHLVVATSYVLTETLFALLLLLVGVTMSAFLRNSSWKIAAVLGTLLGLAFLVRPDVQFMPLLVAGSICIYLRGRVGVKLAAVVLAGWLLTVSPWFMRNLLTLGCWTDDTIQVGFLHHGIYPDFMLDGRPETYGFPYRHDPRGKDISRNQGTVLKEISDRFRQEPWKYAEWYFLKKPITIWQWGIVQGHGDVFINPVKRTPYWENPVFIYTHRMMKGLHLPMVIAAGLGCFWAWLPSASRMVAREALFAARFSALMLIYFTALHMIGGSFPRYSIPLRPYLYGMALFTCSLAYLGLMNRYR
jgi:4-amino-4-deoxy-L-arabinose transferase-like glycosyltransferase